MEGEAGGAVSRWVRLKTVCCWFCIKVPRGCWSLKAYFWPCSRWIMGEGAELELQEWKTIGSTYEVIMFNCCSSFDCCFLATWFWASTTSPRQQTLPLLSSTTKLKIPYMLAVQFNNWTDTPPTCWSPLSTGWSTRPTMEAAASPLLDLALEGRWWSRWSSFRANL